jgi:hypothetical protein
MPPVGFELTIPAGEWPQTSTRNAELKNEWSCTSTPHVCCWHGQGQFYLFLNAISLFS